ncbi:uncharacterized protein [Amphiura filiformis]|uniref:uncharacterized protein n=1 Tax=Amphiura filiformis TaxID=82378 RepID=UPI003B223B54
MMELWMQERFLPARPNKPMIMTVLKYMFAVLLVLSSSPGGALAQGQAGILQATHDIRPTLESSGYTTTLRPSPSLVNNKTSSRTPDAAFRPIQTPLHPAASSAQLRSSPGGMMMSDKITANMHATNAKPRSVSTSTTAVFVTTRHFLNTVYATVTAVQPNLSLLHTNSLTAVPITAVNSFMPISSIYNSYASSTALQLMPVTPTIASNAMLQTTKPSLFASPSTLLPNSATVLLEQSKQVEVNDIPIYINPSASLSTSSVTSSVHVNIKPSDSSPFVEITSTIPSIKSVRTPSFYDSIIASISNIASDLVDASVIPTVMHSKTTVHIESSKTFLFHEYSVSDLSTISLVDVSTIPTTLTTIVETPVYIQPSSIKQSRVNSDIFSNSYNIETSRVQSLTTTPPLHIPFYTSGSSQSLLPSTSEQMYGNTAVHGLTSLLDSTIDLGTVTETTTLFVESSEARTMPLLLSVSHSAEQETSVTALPRLSSSAVASVLPVTVTEFSTIAMTHVADNVYSTVFLSSTLLEETTLYLSPSVHSQAIMSSTLSSSSNFTSLPSFPGLPYPISSSTKYKFHTSSLQPSSDILSSDMFVTSTAFETTTMLALTKQLTSMWTTSGPSNSLPFMTKQVHASSAVQLNSSSYTYQSAELDDRSLSSTMEIISQFPSSSIANGTSEVVIFPPPVATRTPSLQSTHMQASLSTNSLNTDEYSDIESTVFMTIEPSSVAVSPSPSLIRYNSDSATQTINRTQSFIAPIVSTSETELPIIASPSLSSSSAFLSPTPSLSPKVISTTVATMAAMTPSPTSSLIMNSTSSILLPPQDVFTSSFILMSTPTPSMSSRSTAGFPLLPPVVTTSSLPPVVASSSAMPTIMPSPTPVVVINPTGNTLDRSFATKPFWVSFEIALMTQPESFDPMSPNFVQDMEGNLARAYTAGKAKQDQRDQEIRDLLDNLNPDNDSLMNRRRRRAVTVDDVTAQVIDISRTVTNLPDATLVFYIVDDGVAVPAEECKDVMNELDDTQLTHFLGVVVNGEATVRVMTGVYVNEIPITTLPPPGPDKSYLAWFIPVIVAIGLCLFFCCCCWFYCFCCRVPANNRKQQTEGPMDPETLKMLKFKSKYPYRPYDQTPNQTPRGFDVAKEGLGNPALNMEDENKKANGTVETTSLATKEDAKRNGPKLQKRGESIPYGKVIESSSVSSDADSSPYVTSLRSVRGDTDNLLKTEPDVGSSRLASRSVSPGSSANLPLRKLPTTDLSQKPNQTLENGNKKQRKQRNGKQNNTSPSKEENTEEFRRVYMEAQKEISKILEPDMFAEGTLPKGKRRRSSSKSKRHTTSSSSDEAHANELPETHLSRKPISPESTMERQETLQDAKRRVHALIDEAFSLVTSNANPHGNAVAPAPPNQESNTDSPKLSQNSKARSSRRQNQSPMAASPPIHEEEEPPLFERRRHSPSKVKKTETRDPNGTPTRVVIVPVNHVPDQAAHNILWNPYQAEDEITRLNESQQPTYVPGSPPPKVPPKPKPRQQQQSPIKNINKVLPPLHNLPETSLQQSKHHHLHHIANKHSPDGASSGSETGYFQDSRGRRHKSVQNRTRNTGSDSSPSTPTRTSQYRHSSNQNPSETDLLSTIAKEQKLGKPIDDDYDELDMTAVLNTSSGKPHGLVTAVRDELMRLQRRGGDGEQANGREIGPI